MFESSSGFKLELEHDLLLQLHFHNNSNSISYVTDPFRVVAQTQP